MQIDVSRNKVVDVGFSREYFLNNDNLIMEILDSQVWT